MTVLDIWTDNFSPLKSRNVRIYLSGQAISLIGTFLQQTALGLLVYQLSGGAAAPLGVLALCTAVPLLLFSPFTGALADRFSRKRLLMSCHVMQMAVAFALALLSYAGHVALWHIYALGIVMGTVQSVYFPAQQSLLFDLAGLSQIRKLVSINSMVLNIARTGGPAFAGFLIAKVGVEAAFLQNGLSFTAVMLSLWAVRLDATAQAAGARQAPLLATVLMIAREPHLRSLYASAAILHMCGLASLTMAPALAAGDARQTGLILGAAGGGSLIYAVFLSPFFGRIPRIGVALSLSLVWMGAWLAIAALTTVPALRLVAMFMFGLSTSMAMVGCTGTMQYIAPTASRGRLLGLFSVVGFGSSPFASLSEGLLADRIGAPNAVAAAGGAAIVLALALLLQRGWRDWKLPIQAPAPPATGGQTHAGSGALAAPG